MSKYDAIREKYLAECEVCDHTGFIGIGGDAKVCECQLRYRCWVWMVLGGFAEPIVDFVMNPDYSFPWFEQGESEVERYIASPANVSDLGLGLYLFSKEFGRGKTTLAYYIIYRMCRHFIHPDNYDIKFTIRCQNINDLLFPGKDEKSQKQWDWWKAKFFVIDDFGNEHRSAKWDREKTVTTLQKIFHYRNDKKLPTLITSNYSPVGMGGLYGGALDSLLEVRPDDTINGDRFRSIELGGAEDLRISDTSSWDLI